VKLVIGASRPARNAGYGVTKSLHLLVIMAARTTWPVATALAGAGRVSRSEAGGFVLTSVWAGEPAGRQRLQTPVSDAIFHVGVGALPYGPGIEGRELERLATL